MRRGGIIVSISNSGTINLTDISNKLYRRQREREGCSMKKPTDSQLKNFLSKNIKYLNEIFKALQISDYLKYVKPKFNLQENGYEFSAKSEEFLVELLDRYTENNMLEMRRGNWANISDRFIVWIVEGIYCVFQNNNVPEGVLNEIGKIISNITNYPIRIRFGRIFQMTFELEQLSNKAYWPRWKSDLSGDDNCVWLDALEKDLNLFLKKWSYIHASMGEIRREEINTIAEQHSYEMDEQQILRAEIEFYLAEELDKAMKNDKQLNDLEYES